MDILNLKCYMEGMDKNSILRDKRGVIIVRFDEKDFKKVRSSFRYNFYQISDGSFTYHSRKDRFWSCKFFGHRLVPGYPVMFSCKKCPLTYKLISLEKSG